MNVFRAVFLLSTVLAVGGAAYLGYHGIGRESTDLDRSIRLGSPGGGHINASVK